MGSPIIFLQQLEIAISNLARSWGLPRQIIKSYAEEREGVAWPREAPPNLGFPVNIYTMAETSHFKFGTQLGFAKAHHEKITPGGKVGVALGSGSSQIFGVPLKYFCNGRAVLLALAELLVSSRLYAVYVKQTLVRF